MDNLESFTAIRSDIHRLENKTDGLDKKTDALQNDIHRLENKTDGLDMKTDALQNDIHRLENKTDGLDKKTDALQNDIHRLENKTDVLQTDIRGLDEKIGGLDRKIDSATARLAKGIVATQASVSEINEKMATMMTKKDGDIILTALQDFAGKAQNYDNLAAVHGRSLTDAEVTLIDHEKRLRAIERRAT